MNSKENTLTGSEEVAEVEATLKNMLRAQETANLDAFAASFAHDKDMINIGTDLDEIWDNWNSFYEWMSEAISTKKGYTISEKDTRIKISQSGDVAWYSQLLDTCLETKGEPFNLEGFRHTGVMERRNNKWLIVQSHISAPYNAQNQGS